MRNDNEAQLEIAGYADAIGTEEYNIKLSERRARSAARYLVDKGITEENLKLLALGESQPAAPNIKSDGSDNPEGRQLNRRVEFSLEGKLSPKGGKIIALSEKIMQWRKDATKTNGIIYKVQVAAYRHPDNYNNDHLDDLGNLKALPIAGITRFTIGEFQTLKEARRFKKMIVKKGTKDAFITAEVNGERKYLNELRKKRLNEKPFRKAKGNDLFSSEIGRASCRERV